MCISFSFWPFLFAETSPWTASTYRITHKLCLFSTQFTWIRRFGRIQKFSIQTDSSTKTEKFTNRSTSFRLALVGACVWEKSWRVWRFSSSSLPSCIRSICTCRKVKSCPAWKAMPELPFVQMRSRCTPDRGVANSSTRYHQVRRFRRQRSTVAK